MERVSLCFVSLSLYKATGEIAILALSLKDTNCETIVALQIKIAFFLFEVGVRRKMDDFEGRKEME